ncbi:hypothetical protein ACWCQK_01680 [Streptomyces sp. NPDC002306]
MQKLMRRLTTAGLSVAVVGAALLGSGSFATAAPQTAGPTLARQSVAEDVRSVSAHHGRHGHGGGHHGHGGGHHGRDGGPHGLRLDGRNHRGHASVYDAHGSADGREAADVRSDPWVAGQLAPADPWIADQLVLVPPFDEGAR